MKNLGQGGTIKLACDGTIRLTNTLVITQDVELDGTGQNVTLDGGTAVRVFLVQSNIQLTLRHLTVTGGHADQGGGILSQGGVLTLLDSVFHSNQAVGSNSNGLAAVGGAVCSIAGEIVATNCSFATNQAIRGRSAVGHPGYEAQGGAIAIQNGVLQLAGCQFTTNQTAGGIFITTEGFGYKADAFGGALMIKNSEGYARDCQFSNNLAHSPESHSPFGDFEGNAHGGAIHQEGDRLFELQDCVFVQNQALGGSDGRSGSPGDGQGGAISAHGTLLMDRCTFEGNASVGGRCRWAGHAFGGALYSTNKASLNHCLFTANHALGGAYDGTAFGHANGNASGGAICAQGELQILDCTFADNRVEEPSNVMGISTGTHLGGAVFSTAVCVASNSTWYHNRAISLKVMDQFGFYSWGFAAGSAIYQSNNSLTLIHCTITNNTTICQVPDSSFGSVFVTNTVARLVDCYLSGKTNANLTGDIWDEGFNRSSDHSVFFASASSRNDVDTSIVVSTPPTVHTSPEATAWGDNTDGQIELPGGLSNVVELAVGAFHNLALKADGQVIAWGDNAYGQTNVPVGLSNVVAMAARGAHNLALTAEGQVVEWGYRGSSETLLPDGLTNVVAIAAGQGHSMALTAKGQVIAWGDNVYGQTNVPSGLANVVAIAAGQRHSLALLYQPMVPTPSLALSRETSGLELQADGAPGISCLLLRASSLPGPWLPTEPVTFTHYVQRLRPPSTAEPAQFFRLLRK